MSTIKKTDTDAKNWKKPRILIVDGEDQDAESLSQLLTDWGYEVFSARDGAKAVGLLVTQDIDVALMDLQMPAADGNKVMKYIRKRGLSTQVIGMSEDPPRDDAITSLNHKTNHFLRKPVSAVDLEMAIDTSLKKRARKKAQAESTGKSSTTLYLHRLMFDISPTLMFLLDAKGYFRMANKVFLKALGYTHRELIGKHWSVLVDDGMNSKMYHVLEERRSHSGQTPDVEIRLKCKPASGEPNNTKPRTILIALQSKQLYSRRGDKRIFLATYGVARDITQQNKLEELQKYKEFHDSLTGLPNRELFEDYLTFALSMAAHDHALLSTVLITLDDLKQINKQYGYSVGDICLQTVVSRLKAQVRKGDTLSRVDGSEFALLLPNIQEESSILHLINKIRKSLSHPIDAHGKDITLSIRIGLSFFPRDGDSSEQLISHAQNSHEFTTNSENRQPHKALNEPGQNLVD